MRKMTFSEMNRPDLDTLKHIPKIAVTVLLDNVRSLMNVGSVFRTCDGFLIEKIILCGITGIPPHREIQKTALGATETVSWTHERDILSALSKLKNDGHICIGVEQTIPSVSLIDMLPEKGKKYAVIFGSEVDGISNEVLYLLDFCIEIPQGGMKHSLNVSVAAGIVLHHFYEALK